jgi:predicted GNAT family acetyltransferase
VHDEEMSDDTAPEPQVTHDEEGHRLEATTPDGELAGFLTYDRVEAKSAGGRGTLVATHTIVQPHFEGRGVGSSLARVFLDYAQEHHLTVIPQCSFVHGYIDRHEEYKTLLP